MIAAAAEQRYAEFVGGDTQHTGETVHELITTSTPIEREFYDFYRAPRGEFTPAGGSPLLTTHPTLTSNAKFMNFYPFNHIETISPRPRPRSWDRSTRSAARSRCSIGSETRPLAASG